MPEIIVVQPFNLRGKDGVLKSFRPSTMRLRVSDSEARDPVLRECSLRVEEQVRAPEIVRIPGKQKKGLKRGEHNSNPE